MFLEEEEQDQISSKVEAAGPNNKKRKSGRHAYVHKPYLYSKYYSDSDDEQTVEQRRLSVVKLSRTELLFYSAFLTKKYSLYSQG